MGMEYKEIADLIKLLNKSNISELKVKDGDFEVQLRTKEYVEAVKTKNVVASVPSAPQAMAPVAMQPSAPAEVANTEPAQEQPAAAKEDTSNLITVKSPMIGTFYRAPSPDKDPYAKVGDMVNTGDVLCIIEAMKLFNEIESEYTGKVVKVLVDDSSPVEYDQPLFLLDPNA